jgi:hypothetical protein
MLAGLVHGIAFYRQPALRACRPPAMLARVVRCSGGGHASGWKDVSIDPVGPAARLFERGPGGRRIGGRQLNDDKHHAGSQSRRDRGAQAAGPPPADRAERMRVVGRRCHRGTRRGVIRTADLRITGMPRTGLRPAAALAGGAKVSLIGNIVRICRDLATNQPAAATRAGSLRKSPWKSSAFGRLPKRGSAARPV